VRKIGALVRASWLTARSYRLNLVFAFVGLLVAFVPLYLAARALQPLAADSIQTEGREYFGFVVLGLVAMSLMNFAIRALPGAITSGIASGTLEALLATPTRLGTLLAGLVAYPFLMTTSRTILFVAVMSLAGTSIVWSSVPLSIAVLALIVAAHLPFGLAAAALHLVFRTSAGLASAVLTLSTLFGGVYYSTNVIPEVVRPVSAAIPLTYGLRALRRALLAGEPLTVVGTDVGILAAFAAVGLAVGFAAFEWALRYARRAGTLAQY
jgi:ABC-2 type transport system permease protein